MANTHESLTSLFTDIANAIREKTGSTDTLVADQFPEAIAGIETAPKTGSVVGGVEFPDLIGCNGFAIFAISGTDTSGYSKGTILAAYYDGTQTTAFYLTSGSMSSALNPHTTTLTFDPATGRISASGPYWADDWTYQYIYW